MCIGPQYQESGISNAFSINSRIIGLEIQTVQNSLQFQARSLIFPSVMVGRKGVVLEHLL